MSDDRRSIELEVEVVGTPEEVWQAIATGPGISSWYVPHTVAEEEGGAAMASFGEGPEMQVPGRVAAWEPPRRIVFDGGEGVEGLAFEWLIEARDGGTCIVRLVNSGFGSGAEWDGQYDAMTDGWRLFLRNLQLHLAHFGGQSATSMLPMAVWALTPDQAWITLTAALGIGASPAVGTRLTLHATSGDGAILSGDVVDRGPRRIALLIDEPAPGTAFVAAEDYGGQAGVSIWAYLYGPDAPELAALARRHWQAWLDSHSPATTPAPDGSRT